MSRQSAPYLLDTGVVGAIGYGGELARRIDERTGIRSAMWRPLICVVTRGEIVAFMHDQGWGQRRRDGVEELMKNLVSVSIDDAQIWDAFAELKNFAKPNGWSIGDNDLWIAGTAKVLGATLLTTDKDFDPLDDAGLIDRIYFPPKVT